MYLFFPNFGIYCYTFLILLVEMNNATKENVSITVKQKNEGVNLFLLKSISLVEMNQLNIKVWRDTNKRKKKKFKNCNL